MMFAFPAAVNAVNIHFAILVFFCDWISSLHNSLAAEMISKKVLEEAEHGDNKGEKSFHKRSCSHMYVCVPHHGGDYT